MSRFSDLSIRTKLYSLVPATLLAMGIALGLGLYVNSHYGIGGPVSQQLASQKDLISDVQPAVLLLTQPIIVLQELETETNPSEISRQVIRLGELEDQYRTTREKWLKELEPGELRNLIEKDIHTPAEEIFRTARTEYIPLIQKAQAADRPKISQILREKITPQFREQRRINERVNKLADDRFRATERGAAEEVKYWSSVNLIVSILAVCILVLAKFFVARMIVRSTDILNQRMQEVASGASDLTARIQIRSKDELGKLSENINLLIEKIQSIVSKVRASSVQVLSTAAEIASTAKQQESTVSGLSSSSSEVAAAVREISATGKELAGTMNEVNQKANQATSLANAGSKRLSEMESTMQQLVGSTASISSKLAIIREKADNINMVVTTITKVADQTNLLSINAAIEAEKAGEYGRGFLVVAREIRRLADQTAVATLDIENMVRHMQEAVTGGVMQMDKFSEEVRSGVSRVAEINGQTNQIITEVHGLSERFQLVNEGTRNQAIGVDQINEAIGNMTTNIRQTAAALEEFDKATTYLRDSVQQLNNEIGQFKV